MAAKDRYTAKPEESAQLQLAHRMVCAMVCRMVCAAVVFGKFATCFGEELGLVRPESSSARAVVQSTPWTAIIIMS